jgi:hypothetical protein
MNSHAASTFAAFVDVHNRADVPRHQSLVRNARAMSVAVTSIMPGKHAFYVFRQALSQPHDRLGGWLISDGLRLHLNG